MVTLYAFKFKENLTVSIGGKKREDFKKGHKIVVSFSDYLPLLRLGLEFLWEVTISFKNVEKLLVSPEDKEAEAKKAAEAAAKEAEKAAAEQAKKDAEAKASLATAEETAKTANDAVEALKNPAQ